MNLEKERFLDKYVSYPTMFCVLYVIFNITLFYVNVMQIVNMLSTGFQDFFGDFIRKIRCTAFA